MHVSEKVAGDEKLHHFSGNSRDVANDGSTKPDKIDFWNYELCVMLSCGLPLLLDMWQKRCEIEAQEPVAAVVMRWEEVLTQYQENRTEPVLLAYDGFYNANTTREYCAREETRANVVVTASTKPGMFKRAEEKLHDAMVAQERLVSKPGDWCGIYNPTTSETLTKVFDTQKGVGVKLNYCTALKKVARRSVQDTEGLHLRGGYDMYKVTFDACDRFNYGLHGKKWPHKCGGNGVRGEEHHQHNFLVACILQNVISSSFIEINGLDKDSRADFRTYCLTLADELWIQALEYLHLH